LRPPFSNSYAIFSQKAFETYKTLQKWNIFAKKSSNQKCLLFRCRHAVVIMLIWNWTNQCSLFMTAILWDQWGWPLSETRTVTHARDHCWTLDFANSFLSFVSSRVELVPSPRAYAWNGAPRRWLWYMKLYDLMYTWTCFLLPKISIETYTLVRRSTDTFFLGVTWLLCTMVNYATEEENKILLIRISR
jgi:hypothetical protein